ncbi:MAG: hypothetical protein LBR13_05225 [Dysgonamonadaceae bacterium]|nr:hypothetical protein [Dysgonamonadaceae bacterium]
MRSQVAFDADFESGSIGNVTLLDSVDFRISERESLLHLSYLVESRYDPVNPVDIDLQPSARWFYFRMTGVKNKRIYLQFNNTDPLRAVYSYDNKIFTRFLDNEAERRRISALFRHDTVYVAYFTPYTNSFLENRISWWRRHKDVSVSTIGYSSNNRPIKMLTITDNSVRNDKKNKVWLHARTHTSETPCSWQLDGLIESLLANNPDALAIRRATVFYIVPFANPDGVAEGLSRSNSTGVNQEINWDRDDYQTVAEVKALKKTIRELTADRPFDMFLNMHSQVANSSTYWVHTAQSTNERFLRRELLLCYLNMFNNSYLAPRELSFSDNAPRYPEGWIWSQSGDKTLAITLETPYSFFGASNIWVTPDNLRDFGKATLNAISAYLGITTPSCIIIDNDEAKTKGKWIKNSDDRFIYIGNNYLTPEKADSKITYNFKKLPAGKYLIYRWKAGLNSETPTPDANLWQQIGVYEKDKQSNFKYELKSRAKNEIFDAIMLVKVDK